MRVAGLLDPPQALMLPRTLLRVLVSGFLRPARPLPAPRPPAPPTAASAASPAAPRPVS
jgi:hypothetical protein